MPVLCVQYLFIHSDCCVERPPIIDDIDPLFELGKKPQKQSENKNKKMVISAPIFDPSLYQKAYTNKNNTNTIDEEIHCGSSTHSPMAPAFYQQNKYNYKSAQGRNYAASKAKASFDQYTNYSNEHKKHSKNKPKQSYPNYYNDAYTFGYPDPYNYSAQNEIQMQNYNPKKRKKPKKIKRRNYKKQYTNIVVEEEKEGQRYNLWDLLL